MPLSRPLPVLRRLVGDRSGMAQVELALVLGLLLALAFGTAEVARAVLAHQKLNAAAARIADLATREQVLYSADLQGLWNAADHVMLPWDFSSQGEVILSGIEMTDGGAEVIWQARGGGALGSVSRVGTVGSAAVLPAAISLDLGQTLIASETFLAFTPMFQNILPPAEYHALSVNRPRKGELTTLH